MTITTIAPAEVEGVDQNSVLATSPVMDVPSIDEDLEAWLNHEIEKPCDAGVLGGGMHGIPADFLAYIRRPCGCAAPNSVFWCGQHKSIYDQTGLACRYCHTMGYWVLVEATFVERIR
jgi:hypothetical protein